MNRYVVGIRCKDTGIVSALSVVEDVGRWRDDVRASLCANRACAYAMFEDNYEFVFAKIDEQSWSIGGGLNLPVLKGAENDKGKVA